MTIDVTALRERLRASADRAARASANYQAAGHLGQAEYFAGRQAAFLAALNLLDELEAEYAESVDSEFGEGVNLVAVRELEAFGD
jgi:hypothetical protein